MLHGFSETLSSRSNVRWLGSLLFLLGFTVLVLSGRGAEAQRLRLDAGGGWAFPTNNLDLEAVNQPPNTSPVVLPVDLKGGPQVYAGIGFLRSIGEKFELGARLRAHATQIRSEAACAPDQCSSPEGRLLTATIEGRIILTSPGWIHPYLLVGLGVVQTSLDGVTVESSGRTFGEVSVVDAGGDVGLGASVPIAGGLHLDAEVRATGSLPGGKENAVTVIPMTLGLAYNF